MLGSDPELFLLDSKGRAVGAHTVFPRKETPFYLDPYSSSGRPKAFRDGYGVEINFAPENCAGTFNSSLSYALRGVKKIASAKGLTLSLKPTVEVSALELVDAPPDVSHFGCDPSLDAYIEDRKFLDLDGRFHLERYAGCHLHFSAYIPIEQKNSMSYFSPIVKQLDLHVGLPLTVIFHHQLAFRRRRYYGQAGEFRIQHYVPNPTSSFQLGLEYRTLGPELMTNHAWLTLAVGMGRQVMEHHSKLKWDKAMESDLRGYINEGLGDWKKLFRPNAFLPSIRVVEQLRTVAERNYLETLNPEEFMNHKGSFESNWPEIPHRKWGVMAWEGSNPMRTGNIWAGF